MTSLPPRDLPLLGRRLLLVEDEYLIARDMEGALRAAGADLLGPFATVREALAALEAPPPLDGAVLDVNLRGVSVWPVVEVLQARGVPVVLATGYDSGAIPPAYGALPRVEKPMPMPMLLREVRNVVAVA